jgi:hypothetical protein
VGGGPVGSPGGLLDASEPASTVIELLRSEADDFTWAAATVGANSAAGYQLAARVPVMAVGGFNGTDPSPTLAQFQEHVAEGRIHWFLGNGGVGRFGLGGRTGTPSSAIASWVSSHFESRSVGGVTVYDLTAPISSSP